MVHLKEYLLLEACLPNAPDLERLGEWRQRIANVMFRAAAGSPLTLFTVGQKKPYSLGYEMGVYEEGKFNGHKYLVTTIEKVTTEQLDLLVASDEFYLGLIVLAIGRLSQSDVENMVLCWQKDIVQSGVEFFRMDSDGLCFYWYNPKHPEEAKRYFAEMSRQNQA